MRASILVWRPDPPDDPPNARPSSCRWHRRTAKSASTPRLLSSTAIGLRADGIQDVRKRQNPDEVAVIDHRRRAHAREPHESNAIRYAEITVGLNEAGFTSDGSAYDLDRSSGLQSRLVDAKLNTVFAFHLSGRSDRSRPSIEQRIRWFVIPCPAPGNPLGFGGKPWSPVVSRSPRRRECRCCRRRRLASSRAVTARARRGLGRRPGSPSRLRR